MDHTDKGREGGRERGREGGREGGREEGREGERILCYLCVCMCVLLYFSYRLERVTSTSSYIYTNVDK